MDCLGVVIPHTIKFRILNMAYTLDVGNQNTIAYRVLADDLGKRVRIQKRVSYGMFIKCEQVSTRN